jgi:hypothetical protein
MPEYVSGDMTWGLILAVVVPCTIALFCSILLHWAGKRSALWNIGFAVVVALMMTVLLLVGVITVLRRLAL